MRFAGYSRSAESCNSSALMAAATPKKETSAALLVKYDNALCALCPIRFNSFMARWAKSLHSTKQWPGIPWYGQKAWLLQYRALCPSLRHLKHWFRWGKKFGFADVLPDVFVCCGV